MSKPIFVAMCGVFGTREQRRIRAAGYCFVEMQGNNLDMFKIMDTIGPVNSQEIFKAAMFAIANSGISSTEGPRTLFGKKLAEELVK